MSLVYITHLPSRCNGSKKKHLIISLKPKLISVLILNHFC